MEAVHHSGPPWFCAAYASWQKGAVDNANGRLRRDLPRDLGTLGDAELQEIILTHNPTPRSASVCSPRSKRCLPCHD
jgi:IS30 family transposase